MESTNIEAKFYEEVFNTWLFVVIIWRGRSTAIVVICFDQIHALECKYHELYTPLYAKRTLIASGEYEPTDEVKQLFRI